MTRLASRLVVVVVVAGVALALTSATAAVAQKQTDAERAATLVVHWQQIIYPAFEDARASIDEENSDHLNALLSQGAVRVIQDHVDSAGVKKTDGAVGRLVAAIVKAASRQPGGSLIIDAAAFEKALDAACPLYPFCGR